MLPNAFDLVEREFPSQNDPRRAQFTPRVDGSIIGRIRLSADVKLSAANYLLCCRKHSEIGYQQRVDPYRIQKLNVVGNARKIVVVCKNVGGDINFFIERVSEVDRRTQFIIGKIISVSTQTEILAADIDRIGSVDQRRLQLLEIAGGRQQFNFTYSDHLPILIDQRQMLLV